MNTQLKIVTLVALAGAVVSACSQAPNQPASTPGPVTPAPTPAITVGPAATTQTTPSANATAEPVALRLVAIGDSIPYNAPYDCPGCTSFVDRYAEAVAAATGRPVEPSNLSEHTGLTLPQLLAKLDTLAPRLAEADVILVGIAHNSVELNADEPCGAPLLEGEIPDWDAIDEECAVEAAERHRVQLEELYSRIAALREGRLTILRTVNRYNDWIGWAPGNMSAEDEAKAKLVVDHWNPVLCETAEQNGFGCADIYRAFNGPDGLTPAGNLLAADHNHPSDRGNELIAEELAKLGFDPLAVP